MNNIPKPKGAEYAKDIEDCNEFEAEPNNEYPLCVGNKHPYCKYCCISSTMEEDYCE